MIRYDISVPLVVRESDFDYFVFKVADGKYQWQFDARYSSCFSLHEKLKLSKFELPNFPPKRLTFLIDESFLWERQRGLDKYFKELPDEAHSNPHMIIFLKVHDPGVKKKPIECRLDFIVELKTKNQLRELTSAYPSFLLSNGEEFYFDSLFHMYVDNMEILQRIKRDLDNIYGFHERLDFLNSIESQKNHALQQILSVEESFHNILHDDCASDPYIQEVIRECVMLLELAHSWAASVESEVTGEISALENNVSKRIMGFKVEGDSLLQLYFTIPDMPEESINKLEIMISEISNQMMIFKLNPESYAELNELRDYYSQILQQMKSGTLFSVANESTVDDLQERMYFLLDELNQLPPDDEKEFKKFQSNLDKLSDDLRRCRVNITKTVENEEKKIILSNRAEDLQQDVADIQRRFTEKFNYHRQNLLSLLKDQQKKVYVNQAKTRHQKQDDDFFEL
jgi:hypothetical protein